MTLYAFVPSLVTVIVFVLGVWGFQRGMGDQPERRLARQLGQFGWSVVGVIALLVALPLGATLRGQILSLLGIVLSGAVALSSTTLLGNMLAGVMLRTSRSFRLGDFIEVGGLQGRVSARGLVQLEIQTADRGFLTMPNLKLISEPVKVLPSEGAIIHVEVSLGYDVPRTQVEETLLRAAQEAGLQSSFVVITALGDFSVVYRVSGQIGDIGVMLTSRAKLFAAVMDHLHREGVEIVSPNFVNSRSVQDLKMIPTQVATSAQSVSLSAAIEEQIFDKAEEGEGIAALEEELDATHKALVSLNDQPEGEAREQEKVRLEAKVTSLQERIASMQADIES